MVNQFSVIIPLYNKGQYIARAIESILNQTIQNFEIIVVDGGSLDDGPDIVKKFADPRIRFFLQSGKGVSNARNEGVDLAKNEVIAFLDADDEWMPNHLEVICLLIEKYPDAGIYTTAYKIQTADGTVKWPNYQFVRDRQPDGYIPDYFIAGTFGDTPVWTSVMVIQKKIFLDIGGFLEGYWYGEDVDLFVRIALKYPIAFSWELGGIYHHEASNRACDRTIPMEYEYPSVISARAALEKGEVPVELIDSVNEYISMIEIFRAVRFVRSGNRRAAQIILNRCKTKLQINEKMKWMVLARIPTPVFLFMQKFRRDILNVTKKI